MIGLIVETVRRPQIFRKGLHLLQSCRWVQCQRGHFDPVGHLAGTRHIIVVPSHQLFGQREHIQLQLKEIFDRVVVLKPIQSPDFTVVDFWFAVDCLSNRFRMASSCCRSVSGRGGSPSGGMSLASTPRSLLESAGRGQEPGLRPQCLEVDLPVRFLAAVALDAVLLELGKQQLFEITGPGFGRDAQIRPAANRIETRAARKNTNSLANRRMQRAEGGREAGN